MSKFHRQSPQADAGPQYFEKLLNEAPAFGARLASLKAGSQVAFPWYPYDTLANLGLIAPLVTHEHDFLFQPGKRYADIGCADGDLAFYLESQDHQCDVYDYAPTNYNSLKGVTWMKDALGSSIGIIEQDLDSRFKMAGKYDLVMFLGILYHLKNPFYVLERLAESSLYLLLSTRIARQFRAGTADVADIPAAYLLAPDESNNDATNFWVFTAAGLGRLVDRAGWDVLALCTVGDVTHSNPQDADRDERAFALLRSRQG
jgi:tRNA (mo5U34)-methyltransferase